MEVLKENSPGPTRFCIVTPTYNSAPYLEQTILSVLSQCGDFEVDYHVQDGGSTDGTIAIVQKWCEIIERGTFPTFCKGVRLTYAQAQDRGMYDAINKGTARLAPRPSDLMTWIGSDDLFASGAFATVLSVCRALPEASFLGGRPTLIDASGIIQGIQPVLYYSQQCMRSGIYDGRVLDFLMQEGSFWRGWLWHKVGGLDASLRLAGDWDLWRRFAQHAEYYAIDTITAFHRRREGQLSQHMDRYYAEVDARLSEGGRTEYERMSDALEDQHRSSIENEREFSGLVVGQSAKRGQWKLSRRFRDSTMPPRLLDTARTDTARAHETFPVRIVEGAGKREGPFEEVNLPVVGVRWMHGTHLTARVDVPRAGDYVLVLQCRVERTNLKVRIATERKTVVDFVVNDEIADTHRDTLLRKRVKLRTGTNLFTVDVEALRPNSSDVTHRLLFVYWYVEPALRSWSGPFVKISALPSAVKDASASMTRSKNRLRRRLRHAASTFSLGRRA
jgi:Glycosyl transferase family 2